jgi:dihydrofolate synthase/folylpolyglutamate synthase
MNTLRIIYGASNDKDWQSILNLFPKEAILYLTEFKAQRSVKAKEWQAAASSLPIVFNCFDDAKEALTQCKSDAQEDDVILICGSFYLLEELI